VSQSRVGVVVGDAVSGSHVGVICITYNYNDVPVSYKLSQLPRIVTRKDELKRLSSERRLA
jgi:hypothetical protein